MSYRILPSIICFYAQKKLNTLNNIGVLLTGVFFYLDGPKFVHAKISLRAHCVHARHRARNLSSSETTCISKQIMRLLLRVEFIERDMTM